MVPGGNLRVSGVDHGHPLVTWQASTTGGVTYTLERSINGAAWEFLASTASTSFSDPDLQYRVGGPTGQDHASYKLRAKLGSSYSTYSNTWYCQIYPPAPPKLQAAGPFAFALHDNYPNPFNPTTTIRYELPTASHVTLTVHDLLGREVATLVEALEEPGYKSVQWNAAGVASGVYLYRLTAGDFVQTRKLLVLK